MCVSNRSSSGTRMLEYEPTHTHTHTLITHHRVPRLSSARRRRHVAMGNDVLFTFSPKHDDERVGESREWFRHHRVRARRRDCTEHKANQTITCTHDALHTPRMSVVKHTPYEFLLACFEHLVGDEEPCVRDADMCRRAARVAASRAGRRRRVHATCSCANARAHRLATRALTNEC